MVAATRGLSSRLLQRAVEAEHRAAKAEATIARMQEAVDIMQTADIAAPRISPGVIQNILDGLTYDQAVVNNWKKKRE